MFEFTIFHDALREKYRAEMFDVLPISKKKLLSQIVKLFYISLNYFRYVSKNLPLIYLSGSFMNHEKLGKSRDMT